MQVRGIFTLAGFLAVGFGAVAAHAAALSAETPVVPGIAVTEAVLDSGEASWYGPRHAGHRTSNGETFDSRRMTAAHPSLPLGTMVRVTDMATGRSVIVRVNDREPPHGVRCIDLSERAAVVLGIHSRGVAQVTVTAVNTAADPAVEVAEAPDPAEPTTVLHGRRHRRRAAR